MTEQGLLLWVKTPFLLLTYVGIPKMGFLSYAPIITCEVHVLGTPTSDKHVVVVLFEGLSKHSGFTGYTALTN